jgi:hypothetical protein
MSGEYDMIQGPIWTETSFGGPVYGDTFGHYLFNILGDYVQTGTAASPNTTSSAAVSAGGTFIPVSATTSFTSGMDVQVGTGTAAEIVLLGSPASGTLNLNAATPLRFAHGSGVAVTNTTGTYTAYFSVLNGGQGQPPTHTFTDRTQVPGTANQSAGQYSYCCLSQLTLTGNSQGIFTYTGAMTSYDYQYPSTAPTANVSSVRATPNWRSLVSINGTQINDITAWEFALNRVVEPIPTNDGSQNPYAIARGKFTATSKLTYLPTQDDTPLTQMLQNLQNPIQIQYSNGLSGTNNVTYTIHATRNAFDVSNINESGAAFGYDVTGKLIANTTDAANSNSGGYSPLYIELVNDNPYY